MAADILLYKPQVVPVGEDQLQHLELTRTLARHFNSRFGNTLIEPKAMLAKMPRLMSLQDPTKKMSKSLPASHSIFLDDEPEVIKEKIKRAVTDTGPVKSGEMSSGVKNLFHLLEHFGTDEARADFESEYADGKIKYSELKQYLGEAIADHFKEYRAEKKKIMAKPASLIKILEAGSQKAKKIADLTLSEVYEKVGLKI